MFLKICEANAALAHRHPSLGQMVDQVRVNAGAGGAYCSASRWADGRYASAWQTRRRKGYPPRNAAVRRDTVISNRRNHRERTFHLAKIGWRNTILGVVKSDFCVIGIVSGGSGIIPAPRRIIAVVQRRQRKMTTRIRRVGGRGGDNGHSDHHGKHAAQKAYDQITIRHCPLF